MLYSNINDDNEKSSLYQELKKGIDSLDKGQKYSDEEVYKELDKIQGSSKKELSFFIKFDNYVYLCYNKQVTQAKAYDICTQRKEGKKMRA